MFRFIIFFILAFNFNYSFGETINSTVRYVYDGDTFLTKNNQIVRLLGIDAPEKKQLFFKESRDSLITLVSDSEVTIIYNKKDYYGRIIGKVICKNKDINLIQIEKGFAWHDKYHQLDQIYIDREKYDKAELSAKAARIGLWSEEKPISPWDFRKNSRIKTKINN